jgi:hypothetical protein
MVKVHNRAYIDPAPFIQNDSHNTILKFGTFCGNILYILYPQLLNKRRNGFTEVVLDVSSHDYKNADVSNWTQSLLL